MKTLAFFTAIHELAIVAVLAAIAYVVNDMLPADMFFDEYSNVQVICLLCLVGYVAHFHPGTFAASAFVLVVMFLAAATNDVGCAYSLRGEELLECRNQIESGDLVVTHFGFKLMILSITYFGIVISEYATIVSWGNSDDD